MMLTPPSMQGNVARRLDLGGEGRIEKVSPKGTTKQAMYTLGGTERSFVCTEREHHSQYRWSLQKTNSCITTPACVDSSCRTTLLY